MALIERNEPYEILIRLGLGPDGPVIKGSAYYTRHVILRDDEEIQASPNPPIPVETLTGDDLAAFEAVMSKETAAALMDMAALQTANAELMVQFETLRRQYADLIRKSARPAPTPDPAPEPEPTA